MSEYDARFGKPIKTSSPQEELNEASKEAFDEWTKPVQELYRATFWLSEKWSDTTAAMAGLFDRESARHHCLEIENDAQTALAHGHTAAAKHFFKREAQFAVGTLGYDDETSQLVLTRLKEFESER